MNETKTNQLFSPIEIGSTRLKHRVVMAPLTRSRSKQPDGIPSDLMLEYYCQRASEGGRIFAQLWHPGRFSHVTLTEGATPVSSSVDPGYWQAPSRFVSTPMGWIQPSPHRALEKSEIPRILNEFSEAVERAKAAGFDGVEVHAGNGYLIDQFLQDGSNKRTDEYGGSVENRCRLLFEVVGAMVSAWASDRISVRITPSGTFNAMSDSNPEALHAHVVVGLNRFGLAYLHIIEPRMSGSLMIKENYPPVASQRARKIFKAKIIANGGFEPDTAAAAVAQGDADAIAFGRYFVSNPDLPKRIREGLPLAAYDRDTFYTFDAKGYTDYPFYNGAAAA